MNHLLRLATISLARFLEDELPKLSEDWWQIQVKGKLSYQQQRLVAEKNIERIDQLDLAALLRVLDQNWFELRERVELPFEGRNWVKEMQTVRNKWAHISAEDVPAAEFYRDADTLSRMLEMLGADDSTREEVEAFKQEQLASMSPQGPPVADTSAIEQEASRPLPETGALFKTGDLVALRSDPSVIFPVLEVISGGEEVRYKIFHENQSAHYYESQLQAAEEEGATAATMDVQSLHACLTSLQLLSPSTSSLFSLRSGRVHFVPYQYRPVVKMIRADRPRLLIADEVGVGKTIESGLIIKELRARMDIQSVLIICPKALVSERKWELEMKRFDEQFTPMDGSLLRHCMKETHLDGEWPDQYSKAILPFSLFNEKMVHGTSGTGSKKQLGLLDLDPPPEFDLVIVDEAHHIRNSETYLHQAVRYFCDHAQAVIFLTATPVQLGSNDLYTLLNVLRPDLVIDVPSFERMAEPNTMINEAVRLCRNASEDWEQQAREQLDEAAQTKWGEMFLRETPAFQSVCDTLEAGITEHLDDADRIKLVHEIEALYTFSPLINRTRRRDIGRFTTRKPRTLNIAFTELQQALHDDLLDLVTDILEYCHGAQNVKFMMTTIRRQAASCIYGLAPLLRDILNRNLVKLQEIELGDAFDVDLDKDLGFVERVRDKMEDLVHRGDNLDTKDPKVEAFIKVLEDKAQMENNKALVFSTFRHTLSYLEKHVSLTDLRYGVIHGGVPDTDRSSLRYRFSLPEDDPEALDVLLSSEVGCEGLDFQFCDLLVNYDLPWNPMRVEQRIGRIDRYGQESEAVSIVNMITPDTVDADIYDRCLMRIGVFQNAIGGSEEILGNLTQQIRDIAENYTLSRDEREVRLQQLSDNEIRQVQEEQKLEEKQAELFGLNLPNQRWEQEIEEAENFWLSSTSIRRCVETYLEDLTGNIGQLMGEKDKKTLRLNRETRDRLLTDLKKQPRSTDPARRQWEKWLKGENPTLSVTFEQTTAADEPETAFINVLHPLVRQAACHMDYPDQIHADLQVSSKDIEGGTYPFAIYRWKKRGVKDDEILEAIALDTDLEDALMKLIPDACDADTPHQLSSSDIDQLEARQYTQWRKAQTKHITENCALIEQRRQSIIISQQARCKLLQDQIEAASNAKIIRMKESQLAHAEADFQRRKSELDQAALSGDVHTSPVTMGTITITRAE